MVSVLAFYSDNLSFFLKNGPNPATFCIFSFFSHDKYSRNLTINDKSIDGVLGIQTGGGSMVGADKSTELWRHPYNLSFNSTELYSFKSVKLFEKNVGKYKKKPILGQRLWHS